MLGHHNLHHKLQSTTHHLFLSSTHKRRPRPYRPTAGLVETELYGLATAGAVAFTSSPRLAHVLRLHRDAAASTPAPTTPSPADGMLWTVITVLAALPFCGWIVWPGIGLLRARQPGGVWLNHYAGFAALYALPLLRSALVGLDELALLSVFFCVLHVQVERWVAPGLVTVGGQDDASKQGGGGLMVGSDSKAQQEVAQQDDGVLAEEAMHAEVLGSWDRKWTLRSMSVTQLLALSREYGIRGRSRMSKRQLLEALEAVGAHDALESSAASLSSSSLLLSSSSSASDTDDSMQEEGSGKAPSSKASRILSRRGMSGAPQQQPVSQDTTRV